jgi:prevent-host-death family protein
MAAYSISDARPVLGDLVRRASHGHERIALTDHGRVAAIMISASELEELEDRLAIAEFTARKVAGDTSGRVTSADARAALGLPAGRA